MYKIVFLLLLIPLAANGQRVPTEAESTGTNCCRAPDTLSVPIAPERATQINPLLETPTPREDEYAKNGFPVEAYEPGHPKMPKVAITKTVVLSKKFLAAHTVYLGSIVYDAELAHQGLAHHRCVEENTNLGIHPSRGEFYAKSLLVFGAVSGLDWFIAKTGIRYLPYIGPATGTAIHLTGGSKWLADCW